ncbi:hypothetical protein DPMN_105454 [Dreissena polymorpha]|uniref:Uncharacterized protein n=1 Tax=Dreissena polymorpha TaxID=45954 RepID=A0A9D4K1V7_DREPO|nr:hypothetical protein DPMN_105454 [Dreissena polymorpha]
MLHVYGNENEAIKHPTFDTHIEVSIVQCVKRKTEQGAECRQQGNNTSHVTPLHRLTAAQEVNKGLGLPTMYSRLSGQG